MPLAPTVAAFADQYGGKYRRRIMNLAAQLDSGMLGARGFRAGPRGGLARRGAPGPRGPADRPAGPGAAHGGHVAGLSNCRSGRPSPAASPTCWASSWPCRCICGFLLYFIVPKFEAIFKDFGVPLPGGDDRPDRGVHFIVRVRLHHRRGCPPIEILLLVFLPFSFVGWVNYDVPFFDRLLKRRHAALILRSLSLFVDAGQPIEDGLATLASHYPTWWVRRKLIKVDDEVQHGGAWIDALRVVTA